MHLIVEADTRTALCRGIQGLAIRAARAVNRALSRTGRVWDDRYHARVLKSPRETRAAIVYVLLNWRKHIPAIASPGHVDPCSSGPWFDGWVQWGRTALTPPTKRPTAPPRTWLASVGWRRGGSIRFEEGPARPASVGRQRQADWRGYGACSLV